MAPGTLDADRMYGALCSYREDPAVYLLKAARGLRIVYLRNETVIERRELVFGLALIALGAETLLWTLALALTKPPCLSPHVPPNLRWQHPPTRDCRWTRSSMRVNCRVSAPKRVSVLSSGGFIGC
jgi:hypothetical protein